jgi:serine/threonine protein kinase
MICNQCGFKNIPTVTFCGECGAKLGTSTGTKDQSLLGNMATGVAIAPGVAQLPRIGEVVASRFQIEAKLGQGGMGAVFRAKDVKLSRFVALKFLLGMSQGSTERFSKEAQTIARLEHPNIARIYDTLDTDRGPCLVLELVSGESLLDRIQREGKVGLAETLRIALAVCDALTYAHNQWAIVHRDVKPNNVLLTPAGDVKIVDFGIARGMGMSTTEQIGTPGYMAPEQEEGASVDYRTDIYALGLMLYHMVTGERPRMLDLDRVPDSLRPLIKKASAHDRAGRYATVAEVRQALAALHLPTAKDAGAPAPKRFQPSTRRVSQQQVANRTASSPTNAFHRRTAAPGVRKGTWGYIAVAVVVVIAAVNLLGTQKSRNNDGGSSPARKTESDDGSSERAMTQPEESSAKPLAPPANPPVTKPKTPPFEQAWMKIQRQQEQDGLFNHSAAIRQIREYISEAPPEVGINSAIERIKLINVQAKYEVNVLQSRVKGSATAVTADWLRQNRARFEGTDALAGFDALLLLRGKSESSPGVGAPVTAPDPQAPLKSKLENLLAAAKQARITKRKEDAIAVGKELGLQLLAADPAEEAKRLIADIVQELATASAGSLPDTEAALFAIEESVFQFDYVKPLLQQAITLSTKGKAWAEFPIDPLKWRARTARLPEQGSLATFANGQIILGPASAMTPYYFGNQAYNPGSNLKGMRGFRTTLLPQDVPQDFEMLLYINVHDQDRSYVSLRIFRNSVQLLRFEKLPTPGMCSANLGSALAPKKPVTFAFTFSDTFLYLQEDARPLCRLNVIPRSDSTIGVQIVKGAANVSNIQFLK